MLRCLDGMKASKLREKLEGFFLKKNDLFEGHRVAAKHLRRLLEVCPVCRGDFRVIRLLVLQ